MPTVSHTQHSIRNSTADLKWAVLLSFILLLPFGLLETVNNTITRQNLSGLIVLFGLLSFLSVAFIVTLAPLVRSIRAGQRLTSNRSSFVLRVGLLVLIGVLWGVIMFDQMPCFMGVPNCD